MRELKLVLAAVLLAGASADAGAELVRCTSKDGKSSVIRRDKCDSPDDIRTPVTAQSPVPANTAPVPQAAKPDDAGAEFRAAVRANDYAKIRELGEPLARAGNATAMLLLSDVYKNGRGVPRNEAAGYYWARKAAEQGDPRGQAAVAALMQVGSGTPRDDAGAVAWLEKSAQQGYAAGQAALGSAYLHGRGVKKDEEKAAFWLRKAAAQGDDYAIKTLKTIGR